VLILSSLRRETTKRMNTQNITTYSKSQQGSLIKPRLGNVMARFLDLYAMKAQTQVNFSQMRRRLKELELASSLSSYYNRLIQMLLIRTLKLHHTKQKVLLNLSYTHSVRETV
jgi:predicted AAA+ superfamily ATPase